MSEINFWEAPVSLLQYGTWKFIAGCRDLAILHFRKAIGNGNTTSLWFDPWMAEGSIANQIGTANCVINQNYDWKVSALSQEGQWHLSIPSMAHFWQNFDQTDIRAQTDDYRVWTENTHGHFAFKSARNAAREIGQEYDFHSIIWFPAHYPKMDICLLRALVRKLLTRDKLVQFNVIQTN